jgi:hypothetical protein
MTVVERDELAVERQLGRRVIRTGDVVKIDGLGRACVRVATPDGTWRFARGFRVLGFRGDEVVVYGAKSAGRAEHVRTFTVDRIGARPRLRPG